ncbi:amidohydrolase family protein [Bradyrhizobium tropiciagri]|uniref:N-acyl-D-amino-acid deacylase family protein n=1 Tax=Bradyrhizobium tropiciagri TaxID=312253 RepID=UPI001BAB3899|nr:amidohydrolase family protein [Bradyrhizobium tropiciagri]
MTEFDLVIRGGEIHDGSGRRASVGDIAISGGTVAAVGSVPGKGREEIDAKGKIVAPGFVDIHTHYDGQALWENRMAPSSNHGVTSVIMGNCGVGFAPCRPHQRDMLVELMEGVEDVPEVVMTKGLPWNWETFPQYLDALEVRQLDVDVAAQVPHSALRVYVMGERAASREPPTSEDLAQMRALTTEAIRAGALGVSTSRNILHRTVAGELAPSLHSEEEELLSLAAGLNDAGAGVFQIIPDIIGDAQSEFGLMRRIAAASRRPLSFSLLQMATGDPSAWRNYLKELESANNDGLRMKAQVFPRPVGLLYGLELSFHPFSLHPSFRALRDLPLAEKVRAMRDPVLRAKLLAERPQDPNPVYVNIVNSFGHAYLMGDPPDYEPDPRDSIKRQAELRNVTPHEYAYDLLLRDEGRAILFLPGANYRDGNLDVAREMAIHPHTVLGLGDGGAHYGMICDASFPTFVLQNWVRDAKLGKNIDLAMAIRALSQEPAQLVGLDDRGLLAPGYVADVNVIDLDGLRLHAPTVVYDLPAGGRRLRQGADGFVATIKNGAITYRDGVHTGALPGRLVRGAQAAPKSKGARKRA